MSAAAMSAASAPAPPASAATVGLTFLTPEALAHYEARTGRHAECYFLRAFTKELAGQRMQELFHHLHAQGAVGGQSLCLFTQISYEDGAGANTTLMRRRRLAQEPDRFARHAFKALYPYDEPEDDFGVHHTILFNPAWAPNGHPGGVRVSVSARDPTHPSVCYLSRSQVDAAHQELAPRFGVSFLNSHEHAHDAA